MNIAVCGLDNLTKNKKKKTKKKFQVSAAVNVNIFSYKKVAFRALDC